MRCFFGSILWLTLLSLGCDQPGPRTYPVSGTVSFDGKMVSDGDIIFVPENVSLAPDGGRIAGGKFTARAKEGSCRVEITALDIGPNTPVVMGSPLAENYIPEHYNVESRLTVEVSATDKNSYEFDLYSPKADR